MIKVVGRFVSVKQQKRRPFTKIRVNPHAQRPYGDVFARGSQRGRRRVKVSLAALNLPPMPAEDDDGLDTGDSGRVRSGDAGAASAKKV